MVMQIGRTLLAGGIRLREPMTSGRPATPKRDASRRHAWLILPLAMSLTTQAHPGLAQAIDEIRFAALALQKSGEALDAEDELALSRMNVDMAETDFSLRLVPLANIGFQTAAANQKVGVEARRRTMFGANIAVGASASRITYNEFSVSKPDTVQTYVRISQGLLRNWGVRYNRAGLTLAELELQKQKILNRKKRQQIILNALEKYYRLLIAREALKQSKQDLKRLRRHLDAVRARVKAGLAPKSDELQSRIALLNAENAAQSDQLALQAARDNFFEQLNSSPSDDYAPRDEIVLFTPVIPENWSKLLPDGSPDWQAWLTDKKMLDLKLFRARRRLLPDLSLNVTAARRGTEATFAEAARLKKTDWSIQFSLNSPIAEKRDKLALQRELLRYRQFERGGPALKRKIRRAARRALAALRVAETRLDISRQKRDKAAQAVDLARLRYRRGLDSNLSVLDAEHTYSQAIMDYLRARTDYNLAAARLAQALGILDMNWLRLSLKKPHD